MSMMSMLYNVLSNHLATPWPIKTGVNKQHRWAWDNVSCTGPAHKKNKNERNLYHCPDVCCISASKLRRSRRTLHSTRIPKIDVFINFCTFMILSLELEPGCDPSFGCFTLRFMNQNFRNQIQNHSNPRSINPGWLKIGGQSLNTDFI